MSHNAVPCLGVKSSQDLCSDLMDKHRAIQEYLKIKKDEVVSKETHDDESWSQEFLITVPGMIAYICKETCMRISDAMSNVDTHSYETLFTGQIIKVWPELFAKYNPGSPVTDPVNSSGKIIYAEVERLTRKIDPAFPKPATKQDIKPGTERTFSETLGPRLRALDGGPSSGAMSIDIFERLLDTLGISRELENWRGPVEDPQLSSLINNLLLEARDEILGVPGQHPTKEYEGRHGLNAWSHLAESHLGRSDIEICLSELERIYTAACLEDLVPLNAIHAAAVYKIRESLQGYHPRLSSSTVSPATMDSWIRYWHTRPPPKLIPEDGLGNEWIATRPVPVPYFGDSEIIANSLSADLKADPADVTTLIKSLSDDSEGAGVKVVTGYDGIQLMAESILFRILRKRVPLQEVALAISILRKTGFPWLPTSIPRLDFQSPKYCVCTVLGAAGIKPDDSFALS